MTELVVIENVDSDQNLEQYMSLVKVDTLYEKVDLLTAKTG